MVHKTFLIAGLILRLESDETIVDSDFFPLFRIEDVAEPDITVRLYRRSLPTPEGVEVFCSNHRRRVISEGTAYDFTFFSDAEQLCHIPYACAFRQDARVILYLDYNAAFWDTMVFDALNLSDLFLPQSAVILHSSFIRHGAFGILFAGQKQQGKSTQAALWQSYRNAVVINGDRAAVRETKEGSFVACGIPFSGTSRICLNEQTPVRAIIFPQKGSVNVVEQLSEIEAFKQLIGCVSYTREDPKSANLAVTLTERIAEGNYCYRLICRPDEGAVNVLAAALHIE